MKKIISILLCIAMAMTFMPIVFAEEATDVAINEENFPDENFRGYISECFDKDKNGTLSAAEIEAVVYINTYDIAYEGEHEDKIVDIKTFEGITYFKNLKTLYCGGPSLTSLDVSQNTALEELCLRHASITELDVSNYTNIKRLYCGDNENLTFLIVGNQKNLEYLYCGYTAVASLDVSGCPNLIGLRCDHTNLTSIDVSKNKKLTELDCSGTDIKKINLKNNHKIKYLYADKSVVILSAETFLRYKFEQNTPEKLKNYIYFEVKIAEFSENKTIDKFCHFAADALIIVTCTPGFWFFLIHNKNKD